MKEMLVKFLAVQTTAMVLVPASMGLVIVNHHLLDMIARSEYALRVQIARVTVLARKEDALVKQVGVGEAVRSKDVLVNQLAQAMELVSKDNADALFHTSLRIVMRLHVPTTAQAKASAKKMASANVTRVLAKQIAVRHCVQMIARKMVSALMGNANVGLALAVKIALVPNAALQSRVWLVLDTVHACYLLWFLKHGVSANPDGMDLTVSMVM
jgi:hypothetical protein